MDTSKRNRRVHRRMCAAPEVLEDRVVMSAGEGSTFAILPGTVGNVGQVSSVQFKIDPTLFTAPKGGKLLLGIDVAPATPASSTSTTTTASLKPEIVSITDSSGHVIPVQHSKYNAKVAKANKLGDTPTSAALVNVKVPNKGQPDNDYSVQVKGLELTTGQYLVGFYLPGDVAGSGTVTQADLQTIKKDKGLTAMNSKYSFDADVNRDGVINHQDYEDAKKDLGASTLVSPVVSVNLDPASDPAADRTTPFSTVGFNGALTPNATISFLDNSSGVTSTSSANSLGTYSISVPLVTGSNTFSVTTQDGFGQSITGSITPVVYSPSAAS
jgi:hypothetical protein